MFEVEWREKMEEKTSQRIAGLLPNNAWFQLINDSPIEKNALCIVEEEEEVTITGIIWEIEQDIRKYLGSGHAARLLISSFEPNLTIIEKKHP
ncbi:MAG: hypothetical protein ACRBFS_01185 [Aureispira sp.]